VSEAPYAAAPAHGSLASPRSAHRGCALLALAILAFHFASFDVRRQPIVTDVRYSVYFAARTADGAVPHRDFFDNRTQLSAVAGGLLHRAGETLGTDPLLAIRVGSLTLAALTGLLLFFVQRTLAGGACAAGLIAVLAYVGFTLLGVLPSIGPFPKLAMALLATAACLLAFRERWLLAGACAALAAADWQIGGIAVVAVLAAAATEGSRPRRALGLALCGALALGIAAVAYLAAQGALGPTFEQTVAASFARGTSALEGETAMDRLARIARVTGRGTPGHLWLVACGVAGALVYPLWLRRHHGRPTGRLATSLGVYHYGLVAFSLLDFQLFGDLFALLQSVAFFAGVALIEALERLPDARWVAPAFVGALAFAVWLSGGVPDVRLPDPMVTRQATLADQRTVASALAERIAGKRLAVLGPSELLYLTHTTNALPFIYWNAATHSLYRISPEETERDALYRLLRAADPDAIVYPHRLGHDPRLDADYAPVELASPGRDYRVIVLERRGS